MTVLREPEDGSCPNARAFWVRFAIHAEEELVERVVQAVKRFGSWGYTALSKCSDMRQAFAVSRT
jgi:hypothetical protein